MTSSTLPKRILIVDDHEDAADTMADLLALHGYITAAAHGGQEALDVISVFHPDVIFLDLGMPPPDGFTVATTLRQQYTKEALVLIAYSAWTDNSTRSKTQACGFNHHIAKPASIEMLLHTLS